MPSSGTMAFKGSIHGVTRRTMNKKKKSLRATTMGLGRGNCVSVVGAMATNIAHFEDGFEERVLECDLNNSIRWSRSF